jgi:hypothetical protein
LVKYERKCRKRVRGNGKHKGGEFRQKELFWCVVRGDDIIRSEDKG